MDRLLEIWRAYYKFVIFSEYFLRLFMNCTFVTKELLVNKDVLWFQELMIVFLLMHHVEEEI